MNIKSEKKTCICMTFEDYCELIFTLTNGLKEAVFTANGICYRDTKETEVWIQDINETLSEFFNENVISVHIDDECNLGVWICYE